MNNFKFFLISILLFISLPTNSFSNQSVIYNFSSKKIYYAVKDPSQAGKISPFKSQTIYLNNDKAPLQIYTNSSEQVRNCVFEIYEKQDTFVFDKSKGIDCSLRAERLPKEY